MPQSATVAAGLHVGGNPPAFHGWRIVAALAVTQTVGYGTLYYAFAVLLQPMATTLHASTTTVTGALTASILTVPITLARAGAPLGAAALLTVGGYLPVLTAIGIACLIAAAGILARAAAPSPVPDPQPADATAVKGAART